MEETGTEQPAPINPDDIERRVKEEAGRGPVSEERAKRFYDRVRTSIQEYVGRAGSVAKMLQRSPSATIFLAA